MDLLRGAGPELVSKVETFYLFAFASISIAPMSSGVGEATPVTIELQPSLTVPPEGLLRLEAPAGFAIPVPCDGFERDTFAAGFVALPPETACRRGAGGLNVVELHIGSSSYLSAALRFRFRIVVRHPAQATPLRGEGDLWSLSSAEQTAAGEEHLERNPAIEGYVLHDRLKAWLHAGGRRHKGGALGQLRGPSGRLHSRRCKLGICSQTPISVALGQGCRGCRIG